MKSLFQWSKPTKKYAYFFNDGWAEENELLGTKGANLCEMFRIGMPVPHGFVLSTEACRDYYQQFKQKEPGVIQKPIEEEIERAIKNLELQTEKLFGAIQRDPSNETKLKPPLMLSIRAAPPTAQQGLAPTILNLGLNSILVHTLATEWGNPRWVFDTYAHFLQMFGTVVLDIPENKYDDIYDEMCKDKHVESISQLTDTDLKEVVNRFRSFTNVPEDPFEQLRMAVKVIFDSWYTDKAVRFRELHSISSGQFTAVIVQSMVFGNLDEQSGCGMAFTRNPNTGIRELYGDYLPVALGEEVLERHRNPMKLEQLYKVQPTVYDKLVNIEQKLEQHYRDMQVVEFTVESGELFILETRNGRRSAFAAVRIAKDMVTEKLITEREALLHLNASQLTHFLFATLDPHYVDSYADQLMDNIVCKGKGAGYGVVRGKAVFSFNDALQEIDNQITPVLFMEGGKLAKAALKIMPTAVIIGAAENEGEVRRLCEAHGKAAVIGAQDVIIDAKQRQLRTKDGKTCLCHGDVVTIDGSTGIVYQGPVPTVTPIHETEFQTILQWADKYKRLQVLANADSAEDVKKAIELGAEGVGLCRTEHMFFKPDRINIFRQLILTESAAERRVCLDNIETLQKQDFLDIFRAADNHEIVFKLFDATLGMFFPKASEEGFQSSVDDISAETGVPVDICRSKILKMQDHDAPMGCRGARLAIINPAIMEVQVRAFIGALIYQLKEPIHPDIDTTLLVPFVCSEHELELCVGLIKQVWHDMRLQEVLKLSGMPFKLGAVMEVPRAFMVADRLASNKDITTLCFSSDHLTEFVFGMDKMSAGVFVPKYLDKNLLADDPFHSLDTHGVCNILRYGKRKARGVNDRIKLMISSDFGLDKRSMEFLEREGIDHVISSATQLPKLKVLAAQVHIRRMAEIEAQVRYHPPMI